MLYKVQKIPHRIRNKILTNRAPAKFNNSEKKYGTDPRKNKITCCVPCLCLYSKLNICFRLQAQNSMKWRMQNANLVLRTKLYRFMTKNVEAIAGAGALAGTPAGAMADAVAGEVYPKSYKLIMN